MCDTRIEMAPRPTEPRFHARPILGVCPGRGRSLAGTLAGRGRFGNECERPRACLTARGRSVPTERLRYGCDMIPPVMPVTDIHAFPVGLGLLVIPR